MNTDTLFDEASALYKHTIYVVSEYTEQASPLWWGTPVEKHNNVQELRADPDNPRFPRQEDVDRYLNIYGSRIGTEVEYKFERPSDGIYGYRWKDMWVEVLSQKTTNRVQRVDIRSKVR